LKIKLAQSYGFCFGVKRAIKIAENSKNATTIGPLIHNSKEIERLKNNFNVTTANDISELDKETKRVIIRTHGIQKDDLANLKKEKKTEIIDATCPFVKKPQQICQKMYDEGYDVVIFGDENHPEVKGVKSYANGRAFVVLSVEELEDIKLFTKVAVVSQTTRKIKEFIKIVDYLIQNIREVRVFNTICNATSDNQDSARELATEADVMIIIGGKNSSNTKQLYTISKEKCKNSYLIEDETELKEEWFRGKELCGITAGASTPDWVIQNVKREIEKMDLQGQI